jgi:hypothetical protein
VNDELGELDRGLVAAESLLQPGGRLAVVSFHSLEDRRVKQFLRNRAGEAPLPSRHLPVAPDSARAPSFHLPSRDVVTPRDDEIAANPRARSARLRIALHRGASLGRSRMIRLTTPTWLALAWLAGVGLFRSARSLEQDLGRSTARSCVTATRSMAGAE